MKNLILLVLAIGGFSFGTIAQVDQKKEKKTKSEVVKVKKEKLPTETRTSKPVVEKNVQTEKAAAVRAQKLNRVQSTRPVLISTKQEVNQKPPVKTKGQVKATSKKEKGLTKEKVEHAEEKSKGNAFSGKNEEKVKKSKKEKKPGKKSK